MSSDRLPYLIEPFHQLHSSTYEVDKRRPLMYPYKMHYQNGPICEYRKEFPSKNDRDDSSWKQSQSSVTVPVLKSPILAVKRKSVEEIVKEHWAEYGRNVFTRYDYENVESGGANLLMTFLEASMNASKGKELSANGVTYKVAHTDNFEFTDPVDGSLAKKQGLRVLFEDGSRLVFRLCGTGSAGATIRVYVDSYVSPHDTNKLYSSAQDLLKPLVLIALDLCKMEQFTGRKAPTVIT